MWLRGWLSCMLIVLVLLGLAGVGKTTEADSPTQLVQRLIQTIGSIKKTHNGHLSASDQAHNAAAAKMANAILDIPEVSRRALGRYWKERTPTEQQEFIALLEELFAKVAYPKSAEFFSDLKVKVTDERITDKQAVVRTTVTRAKEGLISVDYRLSQNSDTWRVRDILLDDVSLAMNLRSQFKKIITEHSYEELLRRMREKLAE
jgi:phospholipid transport system substrate-binding protein